MDVNDEGSLEEGNDNATSSMFATNGVSFFGYLKPSTNTEMQIVKKSTQNISVSAHRRRFKDKEAEGSKTTMSRKITQKHFTPRTRHLALTSQSHLRMRTALGDTFPPRALQSRRNFILDLISTAAKESDSQMEDSENSFTDTLQRVLGSEDTLEDIITFVC